MEDVSTIGLDIAKSVFQVHGTNVAGEVVNRTSLTSGVGTNETLPPRQRMSPFAGRADIPPWLRQGRV